MKKLSNLQKRQNSTIPKNQIMPHKRKNKFPLIVFFSLFVYSIINLSRINESKENE